MRLAVRSTITLLQYSSGHGERNNDETSLNIEVKCTQQTYTTGIYFFCLSVLTPAKSSRAVKSPSFLGTLEDERAVLYKTKSLDGTKPNTNPNTNPNPELFYAFFRAPSHDLQISHYLFLRVEAGYVEANDNTAIWHTCQHIPPKHIYDVKNSHGICTSSLVQGCL